MADIKSTETLVYRILESDKRARYDDRYLFLQVLMAKNVNVNQSVCEFLMNSEYPSFETVRRTRQKIQACVPVLRPDSKHQRKRKEAEEDFLRYARG